MKAVSRPEFQKAVTALNRITRSHARGSALRGLELTALAFGALLDVYASPNPDNKLGMCDDKAAFRKHFAELIAKGPTA